MDLPRLKIGTMVTCGFCGIDHKILEVMVVNGGLGVELARAHRNGFCEKCALFVRDISTDAKTVCPSCPNCH
jgi:hypothetical protein